MGGGAAMRAASKVAGLGALNGGLRGGLSSVPPISRSLRNVSRPVAATISSRNVSSGDIAEVQKATWEIVDEWEFAGGWEDVVGDSSGPVARVVFGGVPSLDEAKEATSELKDALDKVYLSSQKSSICEHVDSDTVGKGCSLPLLANSEYLETRSCISCDPKSASVAKPAIQAFKLLSESPAAQSVVASIVSDQNVWDAVLKNDALIDFIQSQKNNDVLQDQGSPKMLDETSYSGQVGDTESAYADSGSPPMDFIQTVKHTVFDMVNNVADYLQNIFGFSAADKTSAEADAPASVLEKTLGLSFIGLAMMVIAVVLLKRA